MENAEITLLNEWSANILSDDELKNIFSKGVYCEAIVLDILERRKLSHLAGFKIGLRILFDTQERLNNHKLNGTSFGFIRDARQSFPWDASKSKKTSYELILPDEKAESLATLINYQGETVANCTLGIYQNSLGGRVAVAGYSPWNDLLFKNKSDSIKSLMRWLAHDKLIAEVLSYHRVALWGRYDQNNNKNIIQLLNASFDCAKSIIIRLSRVNNNNNATFINLSGDELQLTGILDDAGHVCFELPNIQPWSLAIIIS